MGYTKFVASIVDVFALGISFFIKWFGCNLLGIRKMEGNTLVIVSACCLCHDHDDV